MKCLIINHDADYKDDLLRLFAEYNPDVIRYTDFTARQADQYDFIVLSGGSILIDGGALTEEKEFLRTTNKPVLAICLGFEVMALAFGVTREKFSETRKGFFDFDLFGEKGKLWYWHNYYITDLPRGFHLIREQENFIDVIEHESKPLFGLQGHPEKSGVFGEKMCDLLINRYVLRK